MSVRGQTRCARECLCPTMSPALVSINYSHSHGRNGNFLARQRGMDYHTSALHLLNPCLWSLPRNESRKTLKTLLTQKRRKVAPRAFPERTNGNVTKVDEWKKMRKNGTLRNGEEERDRNLVLEIKVCKVSVWKGWREKHRSSSPEYFSKKISSLCFA